MPLILLKETDKFTLGVWEITESLEELQASVILSNNEKGRFAKFKVDRRRKEWLTVRFLLKKLFPDAPEIEYTSEGKPYLPGTKYSFSLSHSQNFVTIILSQSSSCGIDIEDTRRKIEGVAQKFLSEKEWINIGEIDRIKKLFLHWCGKETIFKLIDDSGIDFARQIHLAPIHRPKAEGQIEAQYKTNNQTTDIILNYLFIKDQALTWAIN